MFTIPPYLLLIGTIIAWIGLMLSWARYIHEVAERRRIAAVARGETPPDIKGASNYERAAIQESAHRALLIKSRERWTGRVMAFGIPILILGVFLINHPS